MRVYDLTTVQSAAHEWKVISMCEICGDNRFEVIESAKQRLIEATNIESRPEEMAVIDSILFRMWQMGWLPGCEHSECTCKIEQTTFDEFGIYDNLTCGHNVSRQGLEPTKFCPNCGAKVVE